MKPFNRALLALIATLSITTYSNAQSKWSAGYQAGLGTMNVNSDKVALTNQGFINRKLSRKIELEAAVGYTSWSDGHTYDVMAGWPDEFTIKRYTWNLTLTAKYYWLQKNKWAMYIPLAITNTYIHMQSKFPGDYNFFEWMTYNEGKTNLAYCISTGVGGNICLSKHFYLNAQINTGLKTRKTFGDFNTRKETDGNAITYGAQAGIGYRF